MDWAARTALSQRLLEDRRLAEQTSDAFFVRHPEWEHRFGPAGRRRCVEDARFHLSFLAGSVQAGRPEVFSEYIMWCTRMLAARAIDHEHLGEHLELLQAHLLDAPEFGTTARDLLAPFFEAARLALAMSPAPDEAPVDERTPYRLAYLAAALAGRRGEAWQATRDAKDHGLSVAEIYRDILIWAQGHLGEMWARAEITVAQEHLALAVTQSVVARLYPEITGPRSAGRALLVGVEQELHVLPAQFAADLLELDGWDVAFVGTHVPMRDVIAAIEREKPDVLGISTTMVFNLPRTVELASAVRARFATLPIVLGGRAVRDDESIGRSIGVEVDRGDFGAFRALAAPAK